MSSSVRTVVVRVALRDMPIEAPESADGTDVALELVRQAIRMELTGPVRARLQEMLKPVDVELSFVVF